MEVLVSMGIVIVALAWGFVIGLVLGMAIRKRWVVQSVYMKKLKHKMKKQSNPAPPDRSKRPKPPPPPPPRVQVSFPLPILCKCIGHRMVFVGADVLGAMYCTRCGHSEPAREYVWPRLPQ